MHGYLGMSKSPLQCSAHTQLSVGEDGEMDKEIGTSELPLKFLIFADAFQRRRA